MQRAYFGHFKRGKGDEKEGERHWRLPVSMCFYSPALDSPYDIYLIMLGCGHYFITFHLFSGVFQLCSACCGYIIERKMQEQRSILFSSFIVIAFAVLSFIHAQIIRAWIICMRPWRMDTGTFKSFWHSLCPAATRHHQALWIASIGSVGLFAISLGLTILACVQTNLQTQIVTVDIFANPLL